VSNYQSAFNDINEEPIPGNLTLQSNVDAENSQCMTVLPEDINNAEEKSSIKNPEKIIKLENCQNRPIHGYIFLIDEFMKHLWIHYLNEVDKTFNEFHLSKNSTLFLLFSNYPSMVNHYGNDLTFLRKNLREYTVLRARTLFTMMERYIPALKKSIFKYDTLFLDIIAATSKEFAKFPTFDDQKTTFTIHTQNNINKFIINVVHIISTKKPDFKPFEESLLYKIYKILKVFQSTTDNSTTLESKSPKTNYLHDTITLFINSHTQLVIKINTYRDKIIQKPSKQFSLKETEISISDFPLFLGTAAITNKSFQYTK